jgi:hypothetical protein
MGIKKQFGLYWLMLLACLGFFYTPAQSQTDDTMIYICVSPSASESQPYLVAFRNTRLVGLVLSEDANLVAYSAANLSIGLYSISSNAITGSYLRNTLFSLSNATSETMGERACDEEYPDLNLSSRLATESVQVSHDRIVIFQLGGTDGILGQDFLGAIAVHFFPDNGSYQKNFQIIQMDPTANAIEMSFPFIREDISVPFAVISNKPVSVKRSFVGEDTIFSSACPSDLRSIFMRVLRGEAIDLFEMMDEASFQLYPEFGLVTDYPAGGFILIDIGTFLAQRDPVFIEGQNLSSIDGEEMPYATMDNPDVVAGRLSRAQVVRVEAETGRLIARFDNGPEVIILEPWLVEISSE